MTDVDRARAFGLMLERSRIDAGKSRKYMAQALGKSINTIQNWESGIGEPGYRTLEKWFDALGLELGRYLMDYKYPGFLKKSTDADVADMRRKLHRYVDTHFTAEDVRRAYFCVFGNTGSSWREQLNMIAANNHCSMRSRVNVAQTVYDNFLMDSARGELVNIKEVMPDIEALSRVVNNGRKSACDGKDSYVTGK